jgi:hypothetical protein
VLRAAVLVVVCSVAVAGATKVLTREDRGASTVTPEERADTIDGPKGHMAVAPPPDALPRAERSVPHRRPREHKRHDKSREASVAVVATTHATQHRDSGTAEGPVTHPHSQQSAPAHHTSGDKKDQQPASTHDGKKEPTPPPRPEAELYHFFNPHTKDHRYLTDYDEGAQWVGYEYRSTEGKIFTQPTPGTTELSGEEGHIGYIFTEQQMDTTALYYCISGYGDLLTTDPAVADNAQAHAWDCQGMVGYVGV